MAATLQNFFTTLDLNDMEYKSDLEKGQAKQLLRNIKLDLVLGKIPFKPNKNLVETPIWNLCKKLSKEGFIIGGSVVLKLYNMVDPNRFIGDVDLFIDDGWQDIISNYDVVNITDYPDEDGETHKRVKITTNHFSETHKYGELKLDIFEKEVPYIIYDGVKISNPLKAFDFKLKYWRGKDYYDFQFLQAQYNRWLNIDEFDCPFNNEFLGS